MLPSFKDLYDAGFDNLLPIIPFDAKLVDGSRIDPSMRGKVPGVCVDEIKNIWHGIDFTRLECSPGSLAIWQRWGAAIGLRTGALVDAAVRAEDHLIALDVDVSELNLCRDIAKLAKKHLGSSPLRFGREPRYLMAYRCAESLKSSDFKCVVDGREQTVQLLGHGKQFVAFGTHPGTGKPYTWRPDSQRLTRIERSGLPLIDAENLSAFFRELASLVTDRRGGTIGAQAKVGTNVAAVAAQDSLKGEQALVREALMAIPNTESAGFKTRDAWIRIGEALRAASQDWEPEGQALWHEWSAQWPGYDPEDCGRNWMRFNAPWRIGADYLYSVAGEHGWNRAQADFGAVVPFDSGDSESSDDELVRPERGVIDQAGVAVMLAEIAESSDDALAAEFLAEDIMQCKQLVETGEWAHFDGLRWVREHKSADRGRRAVAAFLRTKAQRLKVRADEMALIEGVDPRAVEAVRKRATDIRMNAREKAVYEMAKLYMSASLADFDQEPWVLNTPTGAIDLRTGSMTAESTPCLMSTRVSVGSVDACPRWLQFIDEVTEGDNEFALYLQRALGMSVSAVWREHCLFFLYGAGGNGKSVLLDTVSALLGDYADTTGLDTFLASRFKDESLMAGLAGKRLVMVPEVNEGVAWDEGRVKAFSGGGTIRAREKYGIAFSYEPVGTLWFAGQDRPRLNRVDPSIKRRFRMMTFNYTPDPGQIEYGLKDRLVREEGPGILAWLIEGCLMWQREGLGTCSAVELATDEYLHSQDAFGEWTRARLEFGLNYWVSTSDLYGDYVDFVRGDFSGKVMSKQVFAERIKRDGMPGVSASRTASARGWSGVRLVSDFSGLSDANGVIDDSAMFDL